MVPLLTAYRYAGFRSFLVNDSSAQYTDLDFLIKTDVMIAVIGFATNFSKCSAEQMLPGIYIGGITAMDSKGNATPTIPAGATIFHVYCDKLLPKTQIEMIVATVQDLSARGFAEVAAVKMSGSFNAFFRPHAIDHSECLVVGCAPIAIP
jgi:hypothetical protein